MASEYPLSLVIRAVDKATAPLRAINARLQKFTEPVRKLNNSLRAFSEEAGLPRLTKAAGGLGRAIGDVGSEAMALGLRLAGMAAGAAVGFYAIVRQAVDAGDKLGEMAQRVGLSVDAFAALQYSARQADVEQEAFNSAMDQFNKRLGEMKAGGGPLLSFLNQVAPGLAQQMKAAKGTEEAMGLLTQAFERLQDPAKMAALSSAAFGKSGLQMGQWLHQGTKKIEEQVSWFGRIAGSKKEFAEQAGALDNALADTGVAFEGMRDATAGALFPALTELAQAVTELMAGNRGALKEWAKETGAAISAWVKGGGVKRLAKEMGEWKVILGKLVDSIGGLKGVAVGFAAFLALPFISAVVSAGQALWSLGAAILPVVSRAVLALWPLLVSAASALGTFIMGINVAPIIALGSSIAAAAAAVGSFLLAAAPFIAAAVAVGAAGYAIYKYWEPLKELFSDINMLWGAIKETFGKPIESLKYAGQWWGKELGITGGPAGALNPAAALPPAAAGASGSAHVVVDFNNVPRGARVEQAPGGTADLDLSLGYSMTGP